MEDIEIIVKMPEGIYNHIKNTWRKRRGSVPESYIAWGTPLEKHDEEVIKKTVESIWGKPPYTELLDKIKAEIKEMTPTYHNPDWSITDLIPIGEVLKLIDKYKVESENKTK